MSVDIRLRVNGQDYVVSVATNDRLIDVLRDRLGLVGTKQACRVGECGACTVLIKGKPVQACVVLVVTVRGDVQTVEGLTNAHRMLKEGFADEGGFQCGFCTPGQLMQAVSVINLASPQEIEDENWLRRQMSGNVCRCTGYSGIIRAIRAQMTS
jgi:aerobic-type carbon monoxide dehydrogenase small subunit (CoxS/CutS family)